MATLFEMIMSARFHVANKGVAESVQKEIWHAGGYAGLLLNGCCFSGGAIIEVSVHWYDFTKRLLIKSKVKFI